MSLRPIAAQWFELVTVHKELARVMECLSHTGAVELEARSRATDRLLFPGLDDALKAHRELARHYQNYWPAPAADGRRPEQMSETLKSARARLSEWAAAADPIVAVSERLAREIANLEQLRAALQSTADSWPDLHLLAGAGPNCRCACWRCRPARYCASCPRWCCSSRGKRPTAITCWWSAERAISAKSKRSTPG